MHKLIIILLTSLSLYGMESSLLMKEEALLDPEAQEQFLLRKAIERSLAEYRESQVASEESADFKILPPEIKLYIFSFVPEKIKDLMVLSLEYYNLMHEPFMLKTVALFIINKNVKKAIKVYTNAFENDNELLMKAFLDAHLYEQVISESGLEILSKESSLDTNIGLFLINESIDTVGTFIKVLVRSYPQEADIIFIKSVEKGYKDFVKNFLKAQINVNKICDNELGRTALMHAISNNQHEIAMLLIHERADVNTADKLQCTPLILASRKGGYNTVESLVEAGAIVDMYDMLHDTALVHAVRNGNVDITKFLICHGSKFNAKVICIAIEGGYVEIVKYLIDNKDNFVVDNLDKGVIESYNLLIDELVLYSVRYEAAEIVEVLLENGANANGKVCSSALMLAIRWGLTDIVKILIAHGVNIKFEDNESIAIAYEKRYLDIIKLIEEQQHENFQKILKNLSNLPLNKSNYEEFWNAIVAGDLEIVTVYLDNGIDIDQFSPKSKDNFFVYETPLMKAVELKHKGIIKLLLERGAKTNLQIQKGTLESYFGYTALFYAVNTGNLKIVKMLVDKGANVNQKTNSGKTALANAINNGFADIAEYLIKKGARMPDQKEEKPWLCIIS